MPLAAGFVRSAALDEKQESVQGGCRTISRILGPW
jgi:hypothetical protein